MRSPIELLQASFKIFVSNIQVIFLIFIIPAIIGVVIPFFYQTDTNLITTWDAITIVEFLGSIIVLAVVNLLLTLAITRAVSSPESTTAQSAYQFAIKNLVPYLVVSIITGVIFLVGFILLVIPAIIFMVWYAFSMYTVLFEGKKGMDALHASKNYVKGKWLAVFGRLIFLLALILFVAFLSSVFVGFDQESQQSLTALIVSQILNFAFMPISIGYTYLLYLDLKSSNFSSQQIV